MKYLMSKLKSLFKPKDKRVFCWLIDKEPLKNSHIYMKELDCSHIHASKIDASKIKKVWK